MEASGDELRAGAANRQASRGTSTMRRRSVVATIAVFLSAVLAGSPDAVHAAPTQSPNGTRLIPAAGTTSIRDLPTGSVSGLQQPEIRKERPEEDAGGDDATLANRAAPNKPKGPFPNAPL